MKGTAATKSSRSIVTLQSAACCVCLPRNRTPLACVSSCHEPKSSCSRSCAQTGSQLVARAKRVVD
eukprot:6103690-Lingulodinium_polyedra.AAC.1